MEMTYSLEELMQIYEDGKHIVEGLNSHVPGDNRYIASLDEKIFYYRLECNGQGLLITFLYSVYGMEGIHRFLRAKRESDNYLSNNLGLYPLEDWLLEKFCQLSLEAFENCDYLGCWKKDYLPQQYLVQKLASNKALYLGNKYNNIASGGHFGSLYWFDRNNWIEKLRNKKVLVISSHSETMKNQWFSDRIFKAQNKEYGHRETNIQLEFIKPPMSMCGYTPHSDWLDSLQFLKGEVDRVRSRFDFDLALVSCGSYGAPICNYIGSVINKSVFYVGGALQLYFCIKGKRWDKNNIYNPHWVSVVPEEIPNNYMTVENGCYF